MALTENTVVDRIEVILNNQIQVREKNQILRDGKEISATLHRYVLSPGDDLTGRDPRVVAVANALWTNEVIESYLASRPIDPVVANNFNISGVASP